jgi:N-acetylmuramoyl-L-alanine amidase
MTVTTGNRASPRWIGRFPVALARSLVMAAIVLASGILGPPAAAAVDRARDMYSQTRARERALRNAERPPTLRQLREVVNAYERIVRRYPASGYSDNALWQAGNVALLAYQRFGDAADKKNALRLLELLKSRYPSSSLLERLDETAAVLAAGSPARPRLSTLTTEATVSSDGSIDSSRRTTAGATGELVTIRRITRTPMDDWVRVSIEVDGEVLYRQERLENPRRVFFDLPRARPSVQLADATLKFSDDVVQEIRLGRHPRNTTRVVMDMQGVDSYSVFTLYNPFRLIVDFQRAAAPSTQPVPPAPMVSGAAPTTVLPALPPLERVPLPARDAVPPPLAAPSVPDANSNGRFSLARQLGLGVSRIVLDAGHGGHDPGARSNGVSEAELVLDVSLRLRALLEKQPGVEVVMTRDSDAFIPLEERTAIANRNGADLFLSIHANASRNSKARGIESYFLNFASNPEAAAVAARENSASGRTMHSLPDIVRAIALNNKIDESRDFAETVQKAMVQRLGSRNAQLKDLGVKQAPFVVLIGAGMPSVLAEISFVTNKQEGQLLKTSAYRQEIAEALCEAVLRYQKSLKTRRTMAAREDDR